MVARKPSPGGYEEPAPADCSEVGGPITKLTAYVLDGQEVNIRPAPVEREWMNASAQRFAYRCLPLNIANAHGWEILCNGAFSAMWDGRPGVDAVRVKPRLSSVPPAVSHFGEGILTFHIPCLFRTDPGQDLFVTGPINRPKDGISPLTGIIETDWSPYTFTMNWKFTRPYHRVFFERGEPYCQVFPLMRGSLNTVGPEIKSLSDDPELSLEHEEWSASRLRFNSTLQEPGSEAAHEKWQKSYFRGVNLSGEPGCGNHLSRLQLRPFSAK